MAHRRSHSEPDIGFHRDVDRLFEQTLGRGDAVDVPTNVRETATEIVLELELPGVRPADVEVLCEETAVTVRGVKPASATREGRARIEERTSGAFERTFPLPVGIDDARIDATLTDGVLVVRIPKSIGTEPRRIVIRGESREQ